MNKISDDIVKTKNTVLSMTLIYVLVWTVNSQCKQIHTCLSYLKVR